MLKFIYDGIESGLVNIDNTLVGSEYKLKLYSVYFLSAIRFKLTVHDVTYSNLTKLDSLCNKYCKKWLSMPR